MLDTIQYTKNQDGSFTKTVTGISTVIDIQNEILALQAQVSAFEQGQVTDPNQEISDAITNYQAQILILGE